MRGTLHLVSSRDFYAYAVATQDLQRGAWNRLQVGRGVDRRKLRPSRSRSHASRARRRTCSRTSRSGSVEVSGSLQLARLAVCERRMPDLDRPPGGHWEYGGTDAPYVAARHWIASADAPPKRRRSRRSSAGACPHSGPRRSPTSRSSPARCRARFVVRSSGSPRSSAHSRRGGRLLYDLPAHTPRRRSRGAGPLPSAIRRALISYQHRDRVIAPAHRRAVYSERRSSRQSSPWMDSLRDVESC